MQPNTGNIIEPPFSRQAKPAWLPFLTLGITLFGILVQHWDLKPIIYLFWWEVILIVAMALLRMLIALDSRPVPALLFLKIKLLAAGLVFGGMFILFSVVFTFKAFADGTGDYSGLAGVGIQTKLMALGYLAGLGTHFLANGRYRSAEPGAELMRPFVHLLVLMAFLQALTMHLIPSYPELNQAMWVAVAVVVLKFGVDMVFARVGAPWANMK